MSSKENVVAAARALIDELKLYAATVESRSEFSKIMSSAQTAIHTIFKVTGEQTIEQETTGDLFAELREVKYQGPVTYTTADAIIDVYPTEEELEDPEAGKTTYEAVPAEEPLVSVTEEEDI